MLAIILSGLVIGTMLGSFLNVLIDRLPNGENPFKGKNRFCLLTNRVNYTILNSC